jgi:ParB family transcriptional regulator, chromosome partitioning protein
MARLSEKLARQAEQLGGKAVPDLVGQHRPTLTEIPLEQIQPDPSQPRRDLGDLTELKASIQANGLIQPIVVSVMGYGQYQILAGERRFTASKELGLATIPAIVRTVEEQQRLELQLVENLHRKDLTPLEEAGTYQRLIREFGLTQEELARRVGKSQESISETLKLLDLSDAIQAEYRTSDKVSKSVLLEIAKRPVKEQGKLWSEARAGELTVRKLREEKQAEKPAKAKSARMPSSRSGFRYPIHLDGVTIMLQFDVSKPTQEQIVAALEEAHAAEKARL